LFELDVFGDKVSNLDDECLEVSIGGEISFAAKESEWKKGSSFDKKKDK
jgi:hypothetical protein